jgi:hypothetical protein
LTSGFGWTVGGGGSGFGSTSGGGSGAGGSGGCSTGGGGGGGDGFITGSAAHPTNMKTIAASHAPAVFIARKYHARVYFDETSLEQSAMQSKAAERRSG